SVQALNLPTALTRPTITGSVSAGGNVAASMTFARNHKENPQQPKSGSRGRIAATHYDRSTHSAQSKSPGPTPAGPPVASSITSDYRNPGNIDISLATPNTLRVPVDKQIYISGHDTI